MRKQRDAIRHDHGFFLVMGNEDERDSHLALQRLQFHLHLAAKIGVQRRKRFVQQKQARTVHQRAGKRDALLLPAADLCRLRGGVGRHLDHGQAPARRGSRFPAWGSLAILKSVADVFRNGEMGKQRVVLEDCIDAAAVGRQVIEALAAHAEFRRNLAVSNPAMMRSSVVLPDPLSPRMVRNSPSATSREISRSTAVFPNDFATLRMSSNGRTEIAAGGCGGFVC